MGARIAGAGTSRIEVEGVDRLEPATHAVIPDRLVVATFLVAAGLTGGEVTVADGRPEHMDMLLRKLTATGMEVTHEPDGLRASAAGAGRLRSTDVATLPYPGFATDYKPLLVTLLDRGRGRGDRHREPVLRPVPLRGGAAPHGRRHPHRGPPRRGAGRGAPVGRPVRAFDVRAGAALVLAGLVADGETVISDAHHVDRGYEDLDGKLVSLGANVRAGLTAPARPDTLLPPWPPPAPPIPRPCSTPPGPATGWPCPACSPWWSGVGTGARAVAAIAYRSPGQAYTVGITGAPGAGKSTLTDQLINRARRRGLDGSDRVAVLAIDPSSPFSGGAILGDRVRMQNHALDDRVFIRSMATRGHLGGLAVAVPDAVRVLSAVGMPVVLLETVGVGQQEVAVAAATDTTDRRRQPRLGRRHPGQQGRPAGDRRPVRDQQGGPARGPGDPSDLELMLDLTQLGDWRPPIVDTVASAGEGVDELWTAIAEHRDHLVATGALSASRAERLAREFHQILLARVEEQLDALLAAGPVRRRGGRPGRRAPSTPTRPPTGCSTGMLPGAVPGRSAVPTGPNVRRRGAPGRRRSDSVRR